jgi:hypothetical protein
MPDVMISFECPKVGCDGIVEEIVEVGEPDYSAEVHSDGDAVTDEHLQCPECETDYVVSVVNHMSLVSAELLDHDDVRVETRIVRNPYNDYDEYLENYDPPSNAFELYDDAVVELRNLLAQNPSQPEDGILYRMIFSQFIAIFEAFLADRLLRAVIDHTEIKNRLLKNSGIFKDMSLTLAEAVADPDAGWKKMKGRLQSQLYHQLDDVKKLYQIALQVDIFPDETEKAKIAAAVAKRHDCVHRNGRDKDDNLNRFSPIYILDTFKALDTVVRTAEEGAKKAEGNL